MIAIIILRIAFQKSMAWRITVRSITKLFRMWYACATRTWRYFQNTEPEKTQLKALFLHMYFNFSSSYASSDPLSNLPSVQDGPDAPAKQKKARPSIWELYKECCCFLFHLWVLLIGAPPCSGRGHQQQQAVSHTPWDSEGQRVSNQANLQRNGSKVKLGGGEPWIM